jgi:hypothetical protein
MYLNDIVQVDFFLVCISLTVHICFIMYIYITDHRPFYAMPSKRP